MIQYHLVRDLLWREQTAHCWSAPCLLKILIPVKVKRVKNDKCNSKAKFILNFWTQTNFTDNSKTQTKRFYHGTIPPNDANGIANGEDTDQAAPLGAV